MKYEMSLDVALDIIGTLRMLKIMEVTKEIDTQKKIVLQQQLSVLTFEERVVQGLECFENYEIVRMSIIDKIERLYAPILKEYYSNA